MLRRPVVAGEDEERFFVGLIAAKAVGRAFTGKLDFAERLSCQVEHFDLAQHVDHVMTNKTTAQNAGAVERSLARGHNLGSVLAARVLDVHRDNALRRRVEIGQEEKLGAFVAEEIRTGS